MKERRLAKLLFRRLSGDSPRIQVIVGPRQVGKTTAVKSVLNGMGGTYETADSPTPLDHEVIEKWWRSAHEAAPRVLAIDEVQKISGWSEAIKILWDRDPTLKLVVTGSAALLMEKGLKESLAGRFELIRAEHWNFAEAQEIFSLTLDDYLNFGCYPGAVQYLNDLERWGNYIRDAIVEPALGRDLMQLHPVENPSLLRQLFAIAVGHPAHTISFTKLVGELKGKGTLPTLQHYLTLLSHAFLVSNIQKYSGAPIRRRGSPPKLIVHDNALVRSFERPLVRTLSKDRQGWYLENAVGARFLESGWETYYWKDRDLEVDFVVLGPQGEKWAVEVKSGEVKDVDLRGLKEFCRRNKEFEPVLLSSTPCRVPGITWKPIQDILAISSESHLKT